MSSKIQNLIESTIKDGARSTKFFIEFTMDPGYSTIQKYSAFVKSTSLPTVQHQPIEFKRFGKPIQIYGQNKFQQTWECIFYLDEGHTIRNEFFEFINALEKIKYNGGEFSKKSSFEIKIYQLDFEEKIAKGTSICTLYNAFPIEIQPIQYDAESIGAVIESPITFSFSHFDLKTTDNKVSSNAIDDFVNNLKDKTNGIMKGGISSLKSLTSKEGKATSNTTQPVELSGQTKDTIISIKDTGFGNSAPATKSTFTPIENVPITEVVV